MTITSAMVRLLTLGVARMPDQPGRLHARMVAGLARSAVELLELTIEGAEAEQLGVPAEVLAAQTALNAWAEQLARRYRKG